MELRSLQKWHFEYSKIICWDTLFFFVSEVRQNMLYWFGSKRLSFDIASKRWCGMQSNHLERSIGNSPTKFLLRFLFHWIKIINESNYSAHTSLPVFRYESIHHYTSTRLVSFTKLFRKFQKKMIFNTKRS